jgi:TRAP-type C4-dicarboxylate transport system permease small subunit
MPEETRSPTPPLGEDPIAVPVPAPPPPPAIPKQPWGVPLVRFDEKWTSLESRLCVWVLLAEIAALCFWIALKGLSSEYSPGGGDISGLVFRCLITSVLFGFVVHKITKPRGAKTDVADRHAIAVTAAVIIGLFAGRLWVRVGVEYFSNFLNWMQNASLLMLVGGLRGLGTRFTLWLALLGGSIATAKGKHINVDVVMRFLTPRMRVPVAVLGWLAASVMCFAGVVGFADHIAIESFKAPAGRPCPDDPSKECDVPASEKLAQVEHEVGNDIFLMGRQISLDFKSLPKVLVGTKYDSWLHPAEWNEWMKGADWNSHFKPEDVASQMMPEDQPELTRSPNVNVPGGMEQIRGSLIKDLNFVFPFGLLMIALRFLLRAALAISGHVRVDPDAAHEEDEVVEKHPELHPKTVAAREKGAA